MGIISILFLVFGWIFNVKGLVIVSLCISAFFALCLTFISLFSNINDDLKEKGLIENIIQFIVLILSIVKLVR